MTSFVLDASMALAWHFPDEASSRANAIASLSDVATIVLPSHWFAEIANGMLVGERRRLRLLHRFQHRDRVALRQRDHRANPEDQPGHDQVVDQRHAQAGRGHLPLHAGRKWRVRD